MKFMGPTAGYSLLDHRSEDISKEPIVNQSKIR
jgi:hypothetical protein